MSTSGAGVDRIMIPITLGGKVSHPSHSIGCYRNVFFCQRCGCLAQQHLSNLARPCSKIRKARGDRVIKAISNGVLPPGVTAWRDNPVVCPDIDIIRKLQGQLNRIEAQNYSNMLESITSSEDEMESKHPDPDQGDGDSDSSSIIPQTVFTLMGF